MGNGCSGQSEQLESTETFRQNSLISLKIEVPFRQNSLVPSSQLTQMEMPNALLSSPSKPKIFLDNLHTSKVRVPSEESQFQKQFVIGVEPQQARNKKEVMTLQKLPRKSSLKKCNKDPISQEISAYNSFSPKKIVYDKQNSPLMKNIDQYCGNKTKKKRNMHSLKKSKKPEIEIISRRKYSDLPIKSEKTTKVRRKISDMSGDHSYIIGVDAVTIQRGCFTPSPILKRRDSFNEMNSLQKKNVRFIDPNLKNKKPGFRD